MEPTAFEAVRRKQAASGLLSLSRCPPPQNSLGGSPTCSLCVVFASICLPFICCYICVVFPSTVCKMLLGSVCPICPLLPYPLFGRKWGVRDVVGSFVWLD